MLNKKWVIYTDPQTGITEEMSAGKKSTKEWRRLLGLKWDKEAFYAIVTEPVPGTIVCKWARPEHLADPEHIPWLYMKANKIWDSSEDAVPDDGYDFLYQPTTGKVYYRRFRASGEFSILKQNRKAYKSLIKELDKVEPKLKKLSGFIGNSTLSSGFFYAPYVPLLKTPTVLEPNVFIPNKRIMARYGKKLVSPKFYNCVTVKSL
jgi:hypothetical protein